MTNKGFTESEKNITGFFLNLSPKTKILRILSDLYEQNLNSSIKPSENSYFINLPIIQPRTQREILLVLSKPMQLEKSQNLIDLKFNEFPHLSQNSLKNIEIDTGIIKWDPVFSIEHYSGNKKYLNYIWVFLIILVGIGLSLILFYFILRRCKKYGYPPSGLPNPEFKHEQVISIEMRDVRDNL